MTKESRSDKQYLLDVADAIDSINDFLIGVSKEKFEKSYLLQSAVIRQFEIIGEASARLSSFIFDSYSSRKNKGTHKAILKTKKLSWQLSQNNTKQVWYLKCDIAKFFVRKALCEIRG